jgi:hypothetical protein
MSESDDLYVAGYAGSEQLDPAETLTGDNTEDPLDAGYTVPDRASHSWRGETLDEQAQGESLEDHLREEEPEVGEADLEQAWADPRAGRLVAPDEGAHADEEADVIATDVGRAGNAASAEEAAVHVVEDRPND